MRWSLSETGTRVEAMASKDILKLSEVGPASCSGLLGRDKRRENPHKQDEWRARDDGANKKQVSLKKCEKPTRTSSG